MAPGSARRAALMAIRPSYAQAILDGRKRVEFRKRPLSQDIETVLIYETAPTQRIVGSFRVGRTAVMDPAAAWALYNRRGCITKKDFEDYYLNSKRAVALEVVAPTRFIVPLLLSALRPRPAIPQSFLYVDSHVLEQVTHAGSGTTQCVVVDSGLLREWGRRYAQASRVTRPVRHPVVICQESYKTLHDGLCEQSFASEAASQMTSDMPVVLKAYAGSAIPVGTTSCTDLGAWGPQRSGLASPLLSGQAVIQVGMAKQLLTCGP